MTPRTVVGVKKPSGTKVPRETKKVDSAKKWKKVSKKAGEKVPLGQIAERKMTLKQLRETLTDI